MFNWYTYTLCEIIALAAASAALAIAWKISRPISGPGWWSISFGLICLSSVLAFISVDHSSIALSSISSSISAIGYLFILNGVVHRLGHPTKPLWLATIAIVTVIITTGGHSIFCGGAGPCTAISCFNGLLVGLSSGLLIHSAYQTKRNQRWIAGISLAFLCFALCISGFALASKVHIAWSQLLRMLSLQFTAFSLFGLIIEEHISMREEEQKLSTRRRLTDPLTGVFTGRHFLQLANLEVSKAQRYEVPMSLILLSLNDISAIAESYGSEIAEELLRIVSRKTSKMLRQFDVFGRIGIDSFSILLPQTELEAAEATASRMQEAILRTQVTTEDGERLISNSSIGVTTHDMLDLGIDDIMERCLEAVKEAKHKGTNEIVAIDYTS